jgi:RNA polymerase sigma-70 factor (ECF subfamily)
MDLELEAITRLKQGDINGLEYLVNKYYFQALRASFFITLDQVRSEDVVQAVFLKLNSKIQKFDISRPFHPWLMQIVVNASRDECKAQKKLFYIEEFVPGNEITSFEKMIDEYFIPEKAVERTELKEAIWKALSKMSPGQRSVIVMHYYLDMNETEMSEEMKVSKSSIKWWLRSGRKMLHSILQPFNNSDE